MWLARNALGTLRAVKFVCHRSSEDRECFEREFNGLQKFEPISRRHQGLVHVLQIGRRDEDGWFFYVMELADNAAADGEMPAPRGSSPRAQFPPLPPLTRAGVATARPASGATAAYLPRTLSSELRSRGALPLAESLAIGTRLASALAFLHERGLVHRDIKPSNIIFVRGEPKLADVGLVTGMDEAHSLVGTPGYIPQEGPGSAQADIYSLGKVLYETAFGRNRQEFPQLPVDLRARADHEGLLELNEVILKSCESDPRRRYSTAEELRADLELLKSGGSVKHQRLLQGRWAVMRGALAAIVFGLLVAAGTLRWQQTHKVRPLSLNAKALDLYSIACHQVKNRALETLLPAYTNLTKAVELDPGFVDAYFEMFELYFGPLGNSLPPYSNQLENFRAVAEKLRAVAPNSVQYHTANSLVEFLDWRFDQAIAEVLLAIKIDPMFLRAHGLYGFYVLFIRGDADTALKEYATALNLDPERNDTTILSLLAAPYCYKGQFEIAIEKGRNAVNLEPRNPFAHSTLAEVYLATGQYTNCLSEHRLGELASGKNPQEVEARYEKLGKALARGPETLWRIMLAEAEADPQADPYGKAVLHARLGEWDLAITLLNEAFDERSHAMIGILGEHCWDSLRGEKWFQDKLWHMGFRPIARAPAGI